MEKTFKESLDLLIDQTHEDLDLLFKFASITDKIDIIEARKARKRIGKALERNIPMKPIEHFTDFICPKCQDYELFAHHKYCLGCGQKLDWSD